MFYPQPPTMKTRYSLMLAIGFAIGCCGLAWVILFIFEFLFFPNRLGLSIFDVSLSPFVRPWLFVIFFLVPTVLTALRLFLDRIFKRSSQPFLAFVNFALALFFLFAFLNFFVSA